MTQTDTTYLLFPCPCPCGFVAKIDISKYRRTVRRGLQKDYGYRPLPIVESHIDPHNCPVCGKHCKADNGIGTRAALEIDRFSDVHKFIMKALVARGPSSVDDIRLYIDVTFDHKTTARAIATRLSELRAWRVVETVELDRIGKSTGTKYDSSAVVAYKLDPVRAHIIEGDDWQTSRLKLMDGGASFTRENF